MTALRRWFGIGVDTIRRFFFPFSRYAQRQYISPELWCRGIESRIKVTALYQLIEGAIVAVVAGAICLLSYGDCAQSRNGRRLICFGNSILQALRVTLASSRGAQREYHQC